MVRRVAFVFAFLWSGLTVAGPKALTWKAVLVAGDNSAKVFDNARLDFGRLLFLRGIAPENLADLSASDDAKDTYPATAENLRLALENLQIGAGDACLVYLTSHGAKDTIVMANDSKDLAPNELAPILDATCGNRPTVVLLSACYSGIFLTPAMEKPNRIVLTAARKDRTSFGCDDNGDYSFWDECLLDHFREAENWRALYDIVTGCITGKELAGQEERSYPQAFFGRDVSDLPLPDAGWWSRIPPDRLFALLWDTTNVCVETPQAPPDYSTDVCE